MSYPAPTWFNKIHKKDDELSRETKIFSESVLEETKSIYDREQDTIRNEIRIGICSVCRDSDSKLTQCIYGCQICKNCAPKYNGRPVCRRHVEVNFGNKYETMVLLGLLSDLDKVKVLKAARMTKDQYEFVKMNLEERGYLLYPLISLANKPKLSGMAESVLSLLLNTYKNDEDFRSFLAIIGGRIPVVQAGT